MFFLVLSLFIILFITTWHHKLQINEFVLSQLSERREMRDPVKPFGSG
jgi:hypothetical protein